MLQHYLFEYYKPLDVLQDCIVRLHLQQWLRYSLQLRQLCLPIARMLFVQAQVLDLVLHKDLYSRL